MPAAQGAHDSRSTFTPHIPLPFDILGHRADDLVVPDPGPERRRRSLWSDWRPTFGLRRPYEGSVLPEKPTERLNLTRAVKRPVPTRRTSNMAKPASLALGRGNRALSWVEQAVIVISASLFVALCARVTVPLPFTPVPLTLQNFGVLLVGLTLGSRRGFAALALYLVEGAGGIPVFNPAGPGGSLNFWAPLADSCWLIRLLQLWRVGSWSVAKPSFARACDGGLAGGSGAVRRRTVLAGGADSFVRPGSALWALLVRIRGSHQGHDGGRGLNRMATFRKEQA